MRTTRTSVRQLATVVALCSTASCGINLTCVRQESVVTAPGRADVPVHVWIRPRSGLASPVGTVPGDVGLVLVIGAEILDLPASTGVAIASIFDPDLRLWGGPAGWLLAIVPPFTAVPQNDLAVPTRLRATAEEVDAILGEDPAARDTALAHALRRTDPEFDLPTAFSGGYSFAGGELRSATATALDGRR